MSRQISVIVPVYNVEKYLRDCLDSLLEQTFSDYEALLVDDGSTDGSGAICETYARLNSRFHVIHRPNGGLSAARNTGLEAATGRYLCFVDSDDVLAPRYLEVLLEGIQKENSEISACGYQRFAGEKPCVATAIGENTVWSRKEVICELTRTGEERRGEFVAVMWNKLFVRELFEKVRFPVGRIHEDEFVILPLLLQTRTFSKSGETLYFYRQRLDSITGGDKKADLRHLQVLDAFRERCELLRGREEYREIYPRVVACYFDQMLYLAYKVAEPAGAFGQVYRRYARELSVYARWIRGKRYYLFLLCPALYRKRHWKEELQMF